MRIVKKNSGCQVSGCNERKIEVIQVNCEHEGFKYPAFYCLCDKHVTQAKRELDVQEIEKVEA